MSDLNVMKKNIYTIISIMVFISFIATSFVYSDDNDNLYRNDSLAVCGPGYLNAHVYQTIQQAESIAEQQTQHKNLLQNMIEFVLGKTENSVEQDVNEKPRPVLQQKQSSGGGVNIRTAALKVPISNGNSEEMIAQIRNKVQDYIMQVSGTLNDTYQFQEVNGKFFAAWTEIGVYNSVSVKAQFFDAQGNALSERPIALGGGGMSNVSVLPSGTVAVFTSQADTQNTSLTAWFLDSQGNILSDTTFAVNGTFTGGAAINKILELSNGNLAVCYSLGMSELSIQFFDSNYNAISTGHSELTRSMVTDDMPMGIGTGEITVPIHLSVLDTNNGVAIFWNEMGNYNNYNNTSTFNLKGQFFDSQGNMLSSATLTGASNIDASILNISTRPNGNVAVVWRETDFSWRVSTDMEFFDSQGNPIAESFRTFGNYKSNMIKVLSNGDTALVWSDLNPDWGTKRLVMQILDTQGIAIEGSFTVLCGDAAWSDDGASFTFSNYDGTSLTAACTDGGLAVAWKETEAVDQYNWDTGDYVETSQDELKVQLFNAQGVAMAAPIIINGTDPDSSNLTLAHLSALSNGDVVLFWQETAISTGIQTLNVQLVDPEGNRFPGPSIALSTSSYPTIVEPYVLPNGDMLIFWQEFDEIGILSDVVGFKVLFLDSQGNAKSAPTTLADWTGFNGHTSLLNVSVFSNGNLAIFWDESYAWNSDSLKGQFFNSDGIPMSETSVTLPGNAGSSVTNVSMLSNGDVAVFLNTAVFLNAQETMTGYSLATQVFDPSGNIVPSGFSNTYAPPANTSGTLSYIPLTPSLLSNMSTDTLSYVSIFDSGLAHDFSANYNFGDMRNNLKNRNGLAQDLTSASTVQDISDKMIKSIFNEPTFNTPVQKYISVSDEEKATRLIGIINNPSEDQKGVIDVIRALLSDTGKAQGNKGNQSPELVKAQNDLLQAVANILLAQAMPDLLKQGDVSNIKTIFQELDNSKNKIMLDYTKSTRPYYDNMLKDLSKNMAILQGRSLLNPNMTKDELDKLPPSELDKILEKIKNMKDKTFEEEYILQQEAKHRKAYLDPSKKKLESDMKNMLNSFTQKISSALTSAESSKN